MIFLIVDDQDIKVRRIQAVILEAVYPEKAKIYAVGTVNAAVTFLLDEPKVDLMVLDLNLPVREGDDIKELSGLTIIKEITRRPVITRPQAIIGLTADLPIKPEAIRFFEKEGWVLVPFQSNSTDWEETISNRINYDKPRLTLSQKKQIVIIGSAPKNLPGINLGTEHRKIVDTIRMSTHREKFEVILKSGGTFSTLVKALISDKIEILHLSGHGNDEGIAMEAEDGNCEFVPLEAIASLFDTQGSKIKCVLFNTCYSLEQAKTLSKMKMYVIGMNGSTKDNYAESFAQGFYEGIGELLDISAAFQLGIAYLKKSHPQHANVPQLWYEGKVVV